MFDFIDDKNDVRIPVLNACLICNWTFLFLMQVYDISDA